MSVPNSQLLTGPIPEPEQLSEMKELAATAAEIAARLPVPPVDIETYLDDEDGRTLTIVRLRYALSGAAAAAEYRNFVSEWVNEVPMELLRGSRVLFSCVRAQKVPES